VKIEVNTGKPQKNVEETGPDNNKQIYKESKEIKCLGVVSIPEVQFFRRVLC
jgi:hypothetical protein